MGVTALRRREWTELAVGFAVLSFILVVLTQLRHDPSLVYGRNDPSFYWRMADGQIVSAPFGYRILVPLLVSLTPVDRHLAFNLVSSTGLALACTSLFAVLSAIASRGRALLGAMLLLVSPMCLFNMTLNPYMTDPTALALTSLALLAAIRSRWNAFMIIVCLAALTRELSVTLGIIPLAAAISARGTERTLLLRTALVPVALLVVERHFVSALPRPMQLPTEILPYRFRNDGGPLHSAIFALAGSFGLGWAILIATWRRTPPAVRVWGAIAVVSTANLLIAGDWSRLLLPAFPIVCVAFVCSRLNSLALAIVVTSLFMTGLLDATYSMTLLINAVAGIMVCLTLAVDHLTGRRTDDLATSASAPPAAQS